MASLRRPLFKYFGSKFQTVPYYPEPKFDVICETCAGSAPYSCRNYERQIILFEADPDVADLWSWLISVSSAEILALPRAEDLIPGTDLRTLGIPGRGADLIRRWQRTGTNTCWTVSKWNNMPGLWQTHTRDYIAEAVTHIRHWRVFNIPYERIPLDSLCQATWFVDPPYQHVKGYPYENINYQHLAQWVKYLPGQVIVCEQTGADWLPFRPFREIPARCAASRKPGAKSQEVIWTND